MGVVLEFRVDGLTGYDPFYIPLESFADLREGFDHTVAQKVGNDQEHDIEVNRVTWTLFENLEGGAFQRFWKSGVNRYGEPIPSEATPVGLFPWTLIPDAPFCSPPKLNSQDGNRALGKMVMFNGSVYALDVKNNKVLKNTSETWSDTVAGLTQLPRGIFVGGESTTAMYVGQGASGDGTYARWTSNGSSWNNLTESQFGVGGGGQNAQHFLMWNGALVYATGATLRVRNSQAGLQVTVGYVNTAVQAMTLWDGYIYVAKPEGIFVVDMAARRSDDIFLSGNTDSLNGLALLTHQNQLYFSMNDGFFAFNHAAVRQIPVYRVPATSGGSPFIYGTVLNAWSDGKKIWLIIRTLQTNGHYYHYLACYNGLGIHPIFTVDDATIPSTYVPRGVLINGNKLRYSMGNDHMGYLDTDGDKPVATDDGAYLYGLTVGYFDADRPNLKKNFQQVKLSFITSSTPASAVWDLEIHYRKWGDSNWTTLTETTVSGENNQEQTLTIDIPAETGALVVNTEKGCVSERIDFKIMMGVNTSAEYLYLTRFQVIGKIIYPFAYKATLGALVKGDLEGGEQSYDPDDLQAALLAAIAYPGSLKLTHPNGSVYYGHFTPEGGVVTVQSEDGVPSATKFYIGFLEDK